MPWNRGEVSPALAEWVEKNEARLKTGRVLVPGCGVGHDVAWLAARGVDVTGVDIAPTAVELAKSQYPALAERFVVGDLFDLPKEWLGAFDAVVEHTCLSGMPPELRTAYRDGVLGAAKPGGLIVGVWFINPDLDPGETGPPFPLPVAELDAMFAGRCEVLEDYVPERAFPGREGRERLRVLRKV